MGSSWPLTGLTPSFHSTPTPLVQLSPRGHAEAHTSLLDQPFPQTPRIPLTPRQKCHHRDENTPSRGSRVRGNDLELPFTSGEPLAKRAKYAARRTDEEKVAYIFHALKEVDWSLGHFLYHAFRRSNGEQSRSRTSYVDKFLKGHGVHGVGEILELWMETSKGPVSDATETTFNLTTPYPTIRAARPALASFAAQKQSRTNSPIGRQNKRFAQQAGYMPQSNPPKIKKKLVWQDIGTTTTSSVRKILQAHQPLTLEYLTTIASGQPRLQNRVLQVRKTRPIDPVVTHALSSLDFARNREAQLLPMVEALQNIAMCASFDTFAYNSRISRTVAYTTVLRALRGLAEQEVAEAVKRCGRESGKCGLLVIDNMQNYLTRHEPRIGLSNQMNVGLAATFVELEDVDYPGADFGPTEKC